MASLKRPKSCPCGSTNFVHLFKPEKWVCKSCDKILTERQQRITGVCRKCGASEKDKKFKKGKNLCLDCSNEYMIEWRKKNPDWDSDPEFKKRRFEAVRRAKQRSPEAFIKSLCNALTRPSRQKGKRNSQNICPKRLAILNDVQIDFDYIWALYGDQGGKCALSGLPMSHVFGDLCSISIDRVDSVKGYVPGNVQLVCKWVNLAKGRSGNGEFNRILDDVCFSRLRSVNVPVCGERDDWEENLPASFRGIPADVLDINEHPLGVVYLDLLRGFRESRFRFHPLEFEFICPDSDRDLITIAHGTSYVSASCVDGVVTIKRFSCDEDVIVAVDFADPDALLIIVHCLCELAGGFVGFYFNIPGVLKFIPDPKHPKHPKHMIPEYNSKYGSMPYDKLKRIFESE